MLLNKMKSNTRGLYVSIRIKLLSVYLIVIAIIFVVNLYIYFSINEMAENIDKVYESNAMLNEMQGSLVQTHKYMEHFLDTRDTDALEGYYRNEQEYRNGLRNLNTTILGETSLIAEKNIYHMSECYLDAANKAIEAKRGRNVTKYKESYDEADNLYGYINSYIYQLNNQQFSNNSDSYKSLFSALSYSETSNLVILGMAGTFSAVLLILLTRDITSPLNGLVRAAGEVAKGTLDIELAQSVHNDEIGIVTNAFNQMVGSLKNYIEQIKSSMELESAMKEKQLKMEAHLIDAQLKYLQAQINPHFLFNTLNAGAQLAMMEGADTTYQYVQNVADFFRYNVRKNNKVVTLREEIELVDNYMYIIQVRFSGDIRFRKTIDWELVDVLMPGMILQPLIENCINHGVRTVEWEKIIELSVYKERDSICVSVRDNGVGISGEKIERIMQGELSSDDLREAANGVGLDNVISRLRLFYGRDGVVEITSAGENMGTEVAIYIPIGGLGDVQDHDCR